MSKMGAGQHPLILGLIRALPQPGSEWAKEGRDAWIDAARAAFKVAYELPSGREEQDDA